MKYLVYLVDNAFLLCITENFGEYRYDCITVKGEDIGSGMVSWSNLEDPFIASHMFYACMSAIEEIGVEGKTVAKVAVNMLAQYPLGRKILYKRGISADCNSVRFIDSRYQDKFFIPDGSTVLVKKNGAEFIQRCHRIDDYHARIGFSVYHICEYAEKLKNCGGICMPEPIIMDDQAAWKIGDKGYLMVQVCDSGYDYTLYDLAMIEIDGGQLDDPELTLNEARDEILDDLGWNNQTLFLEDYEDMQEKI